jgi:hypothetical protein
MKTCRSGRHQYESGHGCPECEKAYYVVYNAAYNASHKEEIAAYNAAYHVTHKAERVAYYAAHKAERAAYNAAYCASHKAEIAAHNAAYRASHKEENAAYQAAYYAAHKEEIAAYYASHPEKFRYRQHKRRARKRGNAGCEPVTKAYLDTLFEAQDGCCRYCRAPLDDTKHLDHRVPISRGGPHAPSNVCWSCPSCNLKKGKKTELEFTAALALKIWT